MDRHEQRRRACAAVPRPRARCRRRAPPPARRASWQMRSIAPHLFLVVRQRDQQRQFAVRGQAVALVGLQIFGIDSRAWAGRIRASCATSRALSTCEESLSRARVERSLAPMTSSRRSEAGRAARQPRFARRTDAFDSGYQDRAEVVDVGQRRTGDDQIAEHGEEPVAVVVGKRRLGVRDRARRRARANPASERAGVVLGAVDAVGVAGERVDTATCRRARPPARAGTRRCVRRAPCRARSPWSRRPTAARMAPWPAGGGAGDLPRDAGMHQRDVARLAFDRIAEDQRREPHLARHVGRGFERHLRRRRSCALRLPARRGSPAFGVSSRRAQMCATASPAR